MTKKRKSTKSRAKTTSFKNFEKIPFSETVRIRGKVYQTQNYFNRDMSWLSFNERVLNEAVDDRVPLMERIRFIDIFRSNNDEFFMKRVSRFITKIAAGDGRLTLDGHNSLDLFQECVTSVKKGWELADKTFHQKLKPALGKSGIKLLEWNDLSTKEKKVMHEYFMDHVFPILTPLAVDAGHPFPYLSNLSKSIGVCLKVPHKKKKNFARVKIPTEIAQWIPLESTDEYKHRLLALDDLIKNNLDELFSGMKIISTMMFRVTRDSHMGDDDDLEDVEDVMEWVTEGLKERKFSEVVRLEVEKNPDPWQVEFLCDELNVAEEQICEMPSYICYTSLSQIASLGGEGQTYKPFKGKKYHPFDPVDGKEVIFDAISKQDHLVHLPYETYKSSVTRFLTAASKDKQVKAIKIILYRTDADGGLIDILLHAAERGIQVAVVIELKASFDEARNIKWAQQLEDVGIHVSYGISQYKTHAKMILVVRQEGDKLKTYVNIGTGNFNRVTSKFYTDLSYFTCRKQIGAEVVQVFNNLTGMSVETNYKNLLVAPHSMANKFVNLLQQEMRNAKAGKPAEVIAKMNQLEDADMIDALYKASQAGVKITLLIRGFCCLRPGVKDLSENIKVYSLVGRLLEHSRIFYFRGGAETPEEGKIFIGSADWMRRNLHTRVEVITPILAKPLKERMWNIIQTFLKDNQNLWELNSKGEYNQKRGEKSPFKAQQWFIDHTKGYH
jgi:polyphosphate kinase